MSNYVVYAILACSVLTNGYQIYRIDNMKSVQDLLMQKDSLTQSGFNEILYGHINSVKNENIELAKNQGKIEGIISVVNNIKPESNDISAIWHSGYYRGMDQVEYVRLVSYEDGYHRACEDISCPASSGTNANKKLMLDKIPSVNPSKPTEEKPSKPTEEKPSKPTSK